MLTHECEKKCNSQLITANSVYFLYKQVISLTTGIGYLFLASWSVHELRYYNEL